MGRTVVVCSTHSRAADIEESPLPEPDGRADGTLPLSQGYGHKEAMDGDVRRGKPIAVSENLPASQRQEVSQFYVELKGLAW